jgi:hypothetical protein
MLKLDIEGLGIILYSSFAVASIQKGEDYLTTHYQDDIQIQPHIQNGTIVGFGTGSSGTYLLKVLDGYPPDQMMDQFQYKHRLAIHVKDRTVYIRDLYDLLDWDPHCPPNQTLELEDGIYHITLLSRKPKSGIIGDNQEILMYFQKLDQMPKLATEGIPMLVMDDNVSE